MAQDPGSTTTDPVVALLATRERLRDFVRQRVPAGVDPEDVVQDVLTRLLEHADQVPAGRVQAWALTAARNAIVDLLRRRRVAPLDGVGPAARRDEQDATDLTACMRPLLGTLKDADRLVLEQVDAEGRSQADLARELGITSSTLKSRVQRARQRLRAVLEECCDVELDRRGAPLDARRRPGSSCAGTCE